MVGVSIWSLCSLSCPMCIEEHNAQMKLMTVHMQLQKALDSEVHENVRIEEFRSFIEKTLGDTSTSVKQELLRIPQIEAKTVKLIEQLLAVQSNEIISRINHLLRQFHTNAVMAKQQLSKLSDVIMKDIELEDASREAFKKR